MNKKTAILISAPIVLSALLLGSVIVLAKGVELQACKATEIALDSKYDFFKNPTKRECFTEENYAKLKSELKKSREDNLKTKGYEFDINDREKLESILNYEVGKKGGLTIEGATKAKIKEELLKLLN